MRTGRHLVEYGGEDNEPPFVADALESLADSIGREASLDGKAEIRSGREGGDVRFGIDGGFPVAEKMKKPLFLSKQRLSHLVANQGFEPRTCGL